MTCEEIDGICDTVIEGNNFEEFLFNRLWHLQQAATIYPAHRRVLEDMELMGEEEKVKWEEQLRVKWNELPE